MREALVMVVHGHREHALGVILADHVIVEHLANVARPGNPVARLDQRGFVLPTDDVPAKLDAFTPDEPGRAGDQLSDLVLALAAERAVERVFRVAAAGFGHRHSVAGWSNAPLEQRPTGTTPTPFGLDKKPERATATSFRCSSICALDGSTTT